MKTASALSSEAREMPLSQLDISVRSCNTLEREGIHVVEDVTKRTEEDLLSIFNFGVKSIEELYLALARVGVRMNGVLVERKGGGTSTDILEEDHPSHLQTTFALAA
jgi:DNA-directed RNA polymerase alpha subunit